MDGQNIKELDLKSLRRNIGSVSQEPALFSGTIMDNLRIGKMDATEEEIIEAAKTANVHSFISKLPNQYSTEVRLHIHVAKIGENFTDISILYRYESNNLKFITDRFK
jgi:ABC-type multidrug transport system fused ATPase/permease subunit